MGLSKDEDQDVEKSLKKVDTINLQREIDNILEKARNNRALISDNATEKK